MNEPISWDRKKKIFMHANQASPGMGKKTLKLQSFCQLKEKPEILAINELLQCFVVLIFIIVFTIFFLFKYTINKNEPKK